MASNVKPKMDASERTARDLLNRKVREGVMDRRNANELLRLGLPFVRMMLAQWRREGTSPSGSPTSSRPSTLKLSPTLPPLPMISRSGEPLLRSSPPRCTSPSGRACRKISGSSPPSVAPRAPRSKPDGRWPLPAASPTAYGRWGSFMRSGFEWRVSGGDDAHGVGVPAVGAGLVAGVGVEVHVDLDRHAPVGVPLHGDDGAVSPLAADVDVEDGPAQARPRLDFRPRSLVGVPRRDFDGLGRLGWGRHPGSASGGPHGPRDGSRRRGACREGSEGDAGQL